MHSSHSRSSGGSRRAGERGSVSTISSGSSDHRSIETRPPSSGSDSALPCSTVTGDIRPSSMPLTRIAAITGCSASSSWLTTIVARSVGSVSNRTRLASDSRILRASYSSRKKRWSSHWRARSRFMNVTRRGDDEERVERRAAGRNLGERAVALLHEREDQGDRGQGDEQGQRAVGERVLQAAPQHDARSEHVRDADGVDEAERGQEHETIEQDPQRARVLRAVGAEELRHDRNAVAYGVGEDAGDGRVERHADSAALVGVVVEAVAIGTLRDGERR